MTVAIYVRCVSTVRLEIVAYSSHGLVWQTSSSIICAYLRQRTPFYN